MPEAIAAVITVSDRCFAGLQADASGPAVARVLQEAGMRVARAVTVPDERGQIAEAMRACAAEAALVVTTGGTGLAARDVTPEATMDVCTRTVPGLSELMRARGMEQTPTAALSRGVCGVVGSALIVNLPGSPRGAEQSLRTILPLLPHALALLAGVTAHAEESR